jgi:hypothetical protein
METLALLSALATLRVPIRSGCRIPPQRLSGKSGNEIDWIFAAARPMGIQARFVDWRDFAS